uniref:Negatively light-regulated protein n=1 Tax=Arundo donax TaxID=35708 RepID=A0A0A8YQP4_ARUDO
MSEMDSNAAALVANPEPMDQSEDNPMPSAQQQEEAIKKKFGGLMPKKPPLISKDHERAYFDSADWALGKQGVAKPKGPLEALRPKLQPTRQQQQQQRSRRSIYTSSENEDGDGDGAGAEDMNIN